MNHQKLLEELTQELYNDNNALALILYGSLSRKEEGPNSDIDLLVITNEYHLQKRHSIRYGITVEYLEIHMDFINNFIAKMEIPVLFSLADGIVLFDKISATERLKNEARKILDNGPPVNQKWENEKYKTKRRSDITEIYSDLLDVDDETSFNYIVTVFVDSAMRLLLENNKLWPTTRKKTMHLLQTHCFKGYQYVKLLLDSGQSLSDRRSAAKGLIDYVLKPYGGVLAGDAIIFRVDKLW